MMHTSEILKQAVSNTTMQNAKSVLNVVLESNAPKNNTTISTSTTTIEKNTHSDNTSAVSHSNNNTSGSLQSLPETEFQNLSFEALTQVPVHTGSSVLVSTEIAAKKEDKIESKDTFLQISFEGLMRVPVKMATLTKEQKEKEMKNKEGVTSSPINLEYVLPAFSTQALKIMNGNQTAKQATNNTEETGTTSTTTATTSNPPIVPPLVTPIPVPVYIAVANNVFGTVSVLFKNSNGTFNPQVVYDVGGSPLAILSADFNADGLPDLAVSGFGSTNVTILTATAIGVFGPINNFEVGNNPRGLVAGDFNGDGVLDLATANSNDNTVSVLLATGTGSFKAKTDYAVDAGPVGIAVGDFNRDGILDIVVSNSTSATISVLLGTGNGNFISTTSFPSGDATSFAIATGDFNGDNILDFAVSGAASGVASVFLGTGKGTFSGPTNFPANGSATYVAVGDFNEDGYLDLVLTNSTPNTISVLFGTGLGTFGAPTSYPAGSLPNAVSVADFNADGHLDLAVVNSGSNNVSIFFGNGQGSFQNAGSYSVGVFPSGMTVGFVPAGVSGYPISLALGSLTVLLPSADDMIPETTTATVSQVPAEWILSVGTNNQDGSWTLNMSNASSVLNSLTVLSSDFVGARLLTVNIQWMQQDGSLNQIFCFDNLEMYAPGAPIFALPYGDNLTGSDEADTFVIAKSESEISDRIFNFDVQSDTIDLLYFETAHQFSDLNITSDRQGNTLISIGEENQTIILYDVDASHFTEHNVVFDITPYTLNAHLIDIGQGAVMPFMGNLENNGTIAIDGKMTMHGDITGAGKIILGVDGILELQGSLTQDLIFETASESVLFEDISLLFDSPTTVSLAMLLETSLYEPIFY